MDVRIRTDEGCDAQPFLLWDTVWSNGGSQNDAGGDWALAGFAAQGAAKGNAGGLQATFALGTAVTLALFTDRRCPPSHPLARFADGDPRGWWGDGIDVRTDLGETELGSLFWLLERAAVQKIAGFDTARWAVSLAQDALAPLVKQGAAVRSAVTASLLPKSNGILVAPALYGRDGDKIFDRQFEVVWAQIGLR